jgi:hypothetical protein
LLNRVDFRKNQSRVFSECRVVGHQHIQLVHLFTLSQPSFASLKFFYLYSGG